LINAINNLKIKNNGAMPTSERKKIFGLKIDTTLAIPRHLVMLHHYKMTGQGINIT